MASLSFARPGKVSERQCLGDLACLFDRRRRCSGLALTSESFASDLAASSSLRSALFTLCAAISHMGESDLSPEELLDLVARALRGAGSAEGESGASVPADMRDAFLSGYAAWQDRGIRSFDEAPRVRPPAAPAVRGDLAHPLDGVVSFPARRSLDREDAAPHAAGCASETSTHRRVGPAAGLRAEDVLLVQPPNADARPPGIDALVAAAPAWASAVPPTRSSFNDEAFLSRHPYLSPARTPATGAPVPPIAGETPAQPPLSASAPPDFVAGPVAAHFDMAAAAAPASQLQAEDRAPRSPMERLQVFLLHLPPRKVFFALAGLTILAGALAGVMAYRTLHSGQMQQFRDFGPSVAFAAAPWTASGRQAVSTYSVDI